MNCLDHRDQTVWIFLAKFNYFRPLNDLRSLSGELPPSGALILQFLEANVTFVGKSCVMGRSSNALYKVIDIQALRTIAAGNELI